MTRAGRSQLGWARGRLGMVKWPNRRPARDLGRRALAGAAQLNWGLVWAKRARKGAAAVGQGGATWWAIINRGARRRRHAPRGA